MSEFVNKLTSNVMTLIKHVKKHPIVALLIIVSAFVAGVTGFWDNVDKLVEKTTKLTSKPTILVFSLSPSAQGFEESQEVIFGASETKMRTFGPAYPFENDPRGIFLLTYSLRARCYQTLLALRRYSGHCSS